MFSSKAFLEKANEKAIKEGLTNLNSISHRLPHSARLSTSAFQVSATALQQHLDELNSAFGSGRKEYARRMLVATIDGCSSCHTQVPGRNLPAWTFRPNELKGNLFEKAEFMFAVRHYKEALQTYQEFLKSPEAKNSANLAQETALRRQLVIFVRVLRDYADGIKTFEAYSKDKSLPKHMRRDAAAWVKGLSQVSKTPPPNPMTATLAEIEAYADKTIQPLLSQKGARFEPQSFVAFLTASGLIFDYINNREAKDVSPKLLRLLAECDAQISQGYFFSLTDNYLRECIVRYPTSPEARKCYEELETSLTASYSGSAGTNIPDEISSELKQLQKMLK